MRQKCGRIEDDGTDFAEYTASPMEAMRQNYVTANYQPHRSIGG
jgi:hypothetical protein